MSVDPNKSLWKATIELSISDHFLLEDDIEWPADLAEVIHSTIYLDADSNKIILDIFAEENPKTWVLKQIKAAVFSHLNSHISGLEFFEIVREDWVEKSLEGLKPLEVGRFFIHGAHNQNKVPANKTSIQIEASLAFGTGHHETTRGCLLALESLEENQPETILDLGTGSGILAIAGAKLWPKARILGSDNDPDAIIKAKENGYINSTPKVKFFVADGFQKKTFSGKSFDLITANILAGPLGELAPDISRHLNPGGFVILAGLLEGQQKELLETYKAVGLKLKKETAENGWPTLILEKI